MPSPVGLGPFFVKCCIKGEALIFIFLRLFLALQEGEGDFQLFSKGYSRIHKTSEVLRRHASPRARAIFKTKLTATSSSWNIPDLIIDTCKSSFKQVGFCSWVLFGKSNFVASF